MTDAWLLLRAPLLGPVDYSVKKLADNGSNQEFGENLAQLTLNRVVVDDDAQAHEPGRKVFALTAVASPPRSEQIPLFVAEDTGIAEGSPSKLSKNSTQLNSLIRAGAHGDGLRLSCGLRSYLLNACAEVDNSPRENVRFP